MRHIALFERYSDSIDKLKDLQHLGSDVLGKLSALLRGTPITLYHGTNRNFDRFDMAYGRKWREDTFLGRGIFLTPSENIAIRYADAPANSELPLDILKDAERIDPKLGAFMQSIYYRGNATWRLPEFKWVLEDWNFPVDPNDVAELVDRIPGSQHAKDYDEDSNGSMDVVNLFATTSSALGYYQIEDLKTLGFGDYSPKVYTVILNSSPNILLSNSQDEIRSATHDIIVAYDVPNLVDDVPEIIVRNPSLLKVVSKKVIETEYEAGDYTG